MSRLLLPLASIAALVAVMLIGAAVLSAPAPATEAERSEALAAELRCPDCQALSVAESRTRAAEAIRGEIAELVASGASDEEIRGHFVDRYGTWILLAPPDPVARLLPALIVLAAVGAFAVWLLRGRPTPSESPMSAPEPEAQRIRDELEALDG